jgi:acetyltransferase-like isoleucine patch superfamily enzyme
VAAIGAVLRGLLPRRGCGPESIVAIGDGTQINNNAFIKSEGPGIRLGARVLLGTGVQIIDSDFHELHPQRRRGGVPATAAVELGENVFVGDGARILKGVTIGSDSVVGAGSVVTTSIAAGVVAAGNPARVIRELDELDLRRRSAPAFELSSPQGGGLEPRR